MEARLRLAAQAAYELLLRQKVVDFPVDVETLIRRMPDVKLLTYKQAAAKLNMSQDELDWLFPSQDAFTLRAANENKRRYLICYQSTMPPQRRRFTLAHELAHVLLEHDGEGSTVDREANCFAQHLICPRPLLRRASESHAPLSIGVLCQLFGASPAFIRQVLSSSSPLPPDAPIEQQLSQPLALVPLPDGVDTKPHGNSSLSVDA